MTEILNHLRYSTYVIFHPFNGFWSLKHEKRGSFKSAVILVTLLVAVFVFRKQFSGYFYNIYKPSDFNIITELLSVLIPLVLWCVANWSLTTLMDGEGSMKDIFVATSYSLTPMIIIYFVITILSRIMSLDEAAYYYFFMGLSNVWTGALIFISTMIVHQYSVKKTVLTIILIILGIGTMIFIALLFHSIILQVTGFAVNMYREISFRIY